MTKQAALPDPGQDVLISNSPLIDTLRGAASGGTLGLGVPLAQQVFRFIGGAPVLSSKEVLKAMGRQGAIGAGIGAGALGLSSLVANLFTSKDETEK